jgi:hypothetical protein
MKKLIIFAMMLSLSLSSCNGQKKDHQKDLEGAEPETSVKVNKEYDENGNLIRYDSTYTYVYSNIDDMAVRDSILSNFKQHFNQVYRFSDEPFFNDLFFEDSLMQYDFYKNDFFMNRFKNNMMQMEDLFKEMDSIKNSFYQQQFIEDQRKKRS